MNQHLILDQTCPIDNLKNNKQHTFTSSSTPSISQRISSFSLSSNSPIRRLRQHLRLVVTVPSPIRRRRPFSDSSLSTMMVGLVALSSDSEKKLKKIHPNSKLRSSGVYQGQIWKSTIIGAIFTRLNNLVTFPQIALQRVLYKKRALLSSLVLVSLLIYLFI